MFLESPQNSQENTCAGVSILKKLQTEAEEISKNIFFYRTPPDDCFRQVKFEENGSRKK